MKNVLTLTLTAAIAVAMSTATFAQDCGCSQPMPAAPMMAAPIQSYVPSTPMYSSNMNYGIATVAYQEAAPVVNSAPIQSAPTYTPAQTYNQAPISVYSQPSAVYTQQPTSSCCGNTGTRMWTQPAVTYGTPVNATPVSVATPVNTTVNTQSQVVTSAPATSYAAPMTQQYMPTEQYTPVQQYSPVSTGSYYNNNCNSCPQQQRGLIRGRILNRR